jgi:hypothetical protein
MSDARKKSHIAYILAIVFGSVFLILAIVTSAGGATDAGIVFGLFAIGCSAGAVFSFRDFKGRMDSPRTTETALDDASPNISALPTETPSTPIAPYQAKPRERIHLPETDTLETDSFENGEGALDLNIPMFLHYRNAEGEESKRRITVHRLVPSYDDFNLLAFCHERQQNRTFKVSRILDLYDETTGSRIDDPVAFFKNAYAESPIGICRAAIGASADQLLALSFIAHSRDRTTTKDWSIIVEYLSERCARPLDAAIAEQEVRRLECDLPEFRKVLKRLSNLDSVEKEKLIAAAQSMADSAKSPDPMQIAAVQTAEKALRAEARPKAERLHDPNAGSIFHGQTWCVTGSFENFIPREKAMDEVSLRGGTVGASVTSKTTHLLTGSNPGSKMKKALEVGAMVVSEEEFLKLLGR